MARFDLPALHHRMARPKEFKTAKLLRSARRVFRDYGHSATTRQVARTAGISEGVLYQRFGTKDELFLAAFTEEAPSLQGLIDLDSHADEPRDYLASFAARTKDHFRSVIPSTLSMAAHPKYGSELMRNVHRINRAAEIAAMLATRMRIWSAAGRISKPDVGETIRVFVHALHSMAMLEVLSDQPLRSTKPEEMAAFVEVFWCGLQGPL